MQFDEKLWNKYAKQGDVAGIALYASTALTSLIAAIASIHQDQDPKSHLDRAMKLSEDLHKVFVSMTGYTADAE